MLDLDLYLDLLYSCYNCSVKQRLSRINKKQDSKAIVEHLHEYFHADVIKRAGQNIMLLTDHFSSSQTAMLIESEKTVELREGLIILSQAARRPGWIKVVVGNAKGF